MKTQRHKARKPHTSAPFLYQAKREMSWLKWTSLKPNQRAGIKLAYPRFSARELKACLWSYRESPHLNGGDWRWEYSMIKLPESTPRPIKAHLTDTLRREDVDGFEAYAIDPIYTLPADRASYDQMVEQTARAVFNAVETQDGPLSAEQLAWIWSNAREHELFKARAALAAIGIICPDARTKP